MELNVDPYFKAYENLRARADKAFDQVKEQFPDLVVCKQSCADCCHALFDLSLIEAMYINSRFHSAFDGKKFDALLAAADQADRITYKIKRNAYRSLEQGKSSDDILQHLASQRVRCPMLSENNLCSIYDFRPITCRLYGMPMAIGGKGHTCGLTGFIPGHSYPTMNMDQMLNKLLAISAEFTRDMESRHIKMGEILVPLSMALLTDYNAEYLGIDQPTSSTSEKENEQK